MARRRYRRRRRTGRWSSNIQEVGNTITTAPTDWSAFETIMSNPIQTNTFVSQTYTVKNIEISFNIDYEASTGGMGNYIEGITAYIMYVPQGFGQTIGGELILPTDYNLQHPEYIMAYKYLGSPSNEWNGTGNQLANQQYQPFRVKTRLSRKLQTGDSIVLFIKGVNQSTSNIPLRLSGLIRWWTKAN